MWPFKKCEPVELVEHVCGDVLEETEHFCYVYAADVTYAEGLAFFEQLWSRGLIPVVDGMDGPVCLKHSALQSIRRLNSIK